MRGGHMICLKERLLRHFPVCANGNRLPPVVTHLANGEILQNLSYGCNEVIERLGIWIEVDEDKPGKHHHFQLFQRHITVTQLAATELLTLEDELILALEIPAPTVKRAYDALLPEGSAPFGERGAAMRANIVIGLDGVRIDSHQQNRLVADFVDRVVVGLRNLIHACRDLPNLAPNLLVLELLERGIDVTPYADPVWRRVPTRRPLGSIVWRFGRCSIWSNAHDVCPLMASRFALGNCTMELCGRRA
jgi:hypothetical protein